MTQPQSTWSPWARAAAIVAAIILVFAMSWAMFTPLVSLWLSSQTFSYVVDSIVDVSGISPYLVKGGVLLALVPFAWAIAEVLKFGIWDRIRGLFGGKRTQWLTKRVALSLLTGYAAAFFFVMYAASRGQSFRHNAGDAQRWYAVTPEGVRLFDSPGFDPKYGIRLQPVTTDLAVNLERAKRGQIPQRLATANVDDLKFFDPITGNPRVWYHRSPSGAFDLYTESGFDPVTGEALTAVSQEVVPTIRNSFHEAQRASRDQRAAEQAVMARVAAADRQRQRLERYINIPPGPTPAVQIVQGSQSDASLTARVATGIGAAGLLFKTPFVTDGLFQSAFAGDIETLRSLDLERNATTVTLGERELQMAATEVAGSIIHKCSGAISIKVFRAPNGFAVSGFTIEFTGTGFSAEEARSRCDDDAVKKLVDKLKIQ
jgi:hypothetical protein